MRVFRYLAIVLVVTLLPSGSFIATNTSNQSIVYAKEKKKKPKGVKVDGAAKVWNGQEFVDTDQSISPTASTQIFGASITNTDMADSYIKAGKLISKDGNYFYEYENGTKAELTWVNVDIDNDGLYEFLYFGPGGAMKMNGTTPEGKRVNEYGALLDDNGNVKKLENVVAEANVSGINSVTITQQHATKKAETSNDNLQQYLTEVLSKGDMPSKIRMKYILSSSGMTDAQISQYIDNFNWVEMATNYIKDKTDFNKNQKYVRKILIEETFVSCGLTKDESDKAFQLSGYSDWDWYTVKFVNKVLENSVTTSDEKTIKALTMQGLTYDEAKSALSKIYGREVEG